MPEPTVIYLDHAATTPLAPEVRAAMRPLQWDEYGNPSAAHRLGTRARGALERARADVAGQIGAAPDEVRFTSGGTESANLALYGVALAALAAGEGAHIVTSAVEHAAVLNAARNLTTLFGASCTVVDVDRFGRVEVGAVLDALRPDTRLVSVMLANNEIGTLQPIAALGAELQARGVPLHTDAVQAPAWCDLDVDMLGVDLLSLSAHKCYGPKGTGALYLRSGTPFQPLVVGGGQEFGHRAGTVNVAGAVGLAAALRLAAGERDAASERVRGLRDRLIAGLLQVEGVRLTGHPTARLPNLASFGVAGARADLLLLGLDRYGVCASRGSACASGQLEPSHVLEAIRLSDWMAVGGLRFSLGRGTDVDEIDRVLAVLPPLIDRVRALG